jgi:transcriptional regulator with XRE-family HTH domain
MDTSEVTANRIRELRVKQGLTQQELANLASLERKAISRYESGLNVPGGRAIAMLARIFEVSTDYLLGLTDDPGTVSGGLTALEREAIRALRSAGTEEERRRLLEALKEMSADAP